MADELPSQGARLFYTDIFQSKSHYLAYKIFPVRISPQSAGKKSLHKNIRRVLTKYDMWCIILT